jgi:hypothetical protein
VTNVALSLKLQSINLLTVRSEPPILMVIVLQPQVGTSSTVLKYIHGKVDDKRNQIWWLNISSYYISSYKGISLTNNTHSLIGKKSSKHEGGALWTLFWWKYSVVTLSSLITRYTNGKQVIWHYSFHNYRTWKKKIII